MKKIFLIQPRQTGKTTKAMYEYLKDPHNTLFVTHNRSSMNHVHKIVGGDINNFTTAENFINAANRSIVKNIILDEYLFFRKPDVIYLHVNAIRPDNVYIFSTANKTYDSRLFKFIKDNKQKLSYSELLDKYPAKETEYIKNQIYDLYYNFITDPDTVLIDTNFIPNRKVEEYYNKSHILSLGTESYMTEIKNIYLV